MKKLTVYGKELLAAFQEKINFFVEVEKDDFDGMYIFENDIETIFDAVAWLLLTYDIDALNVVDNWIDEFGPNWYMNLFDVKKELSRCLE